MSNYLNVLTTGEGDLLAAAHFALTNPSLMTADGRAVVAWALEEFGPEAVYMDGEIFA